MVNRKLILGSWIVAICLLAGPALADVAGKWEGQVETPVGMVKYTYDLQLKGTELSGKVTRITDDNPKGTTSDIKDAKVNGDEVSFTETLDIQGQQIEVKYRDCFKDQWLHDAPETTWMRGVTAKSGSMEPSSGDNEADRSFPAHRRRHRIASLASSQPLEGSTDPALVVVPSDQSDSVPS